AVEATLREAIAAGAQALRVDWPQEEYRAELAADEQVLAAALAAAIRDLDPRLVICGDHSPDRGTGAVPAFLAHELRVAQALGLVSLSVAAPGESAGRRTAELELTGERRLPGGRRERLRIPVPAVCSVEAAGLRLRRSPLAATLAARQAAIPVASPGSGPSRLRLGAPRPYLPRTHDAPPPPAGSARERLAALSGALAQPEPLAVIGPLDPGQAAGELLAYLSRSGYMPAAGLNRADCLPAPGLSRPDCLPAPDAER
ncbi:MAG: mycofactocin-associated electron transfer flavoprotein beta subunit, partial [Streptosporangiaceae bacterium]